jgi:hypothetical protein
MLCKLVGFLGGGDEKPDTKSFVPDGVKSSCIESSPVKSSPVESRLMIRVVIGGVGGDKSSENPDAKSFIPGLMSS